MGAWGIGSFQNDTALDFIPGILNQEKIRQAVCKNKITTDDYDIVRASAEVVVGLYLMSNRYMTFDQDIIQALINGCNQIIDDEKWHATWYNSGDAKSIVEHLKELIINLNNIK